MALLSIIVPVYNKERYIDECIQSIFNQTFTDFELILVNDGSTDGSGAKCDHYQKSDSRVIVIHQINGGASAARNAGVARSTGKYIGFIDSDDTIYPDMYELLINNALQYDADVSVCRLRVLFPDKTVCPEGEPGPVVLNHDEALSKCLKGDLDRSANNKIYKSALARSVQFEGNIYEDILYTCKIFLKAKNTVFDNVIKYNYLVRDNSVSMSGFNPKYLETVDVSHKMVEMVAKENNNIIADAWAFDIVANISLLNLLLLTERSNYQSQYQQVVDTLKKYRSFISSSPQVIKKHKVAIKIFFISPGLYRSLMYLYCRVTGADVIKRTN
jgi:glycosyltransferase involved in cell wall biosynthesis